MKQAIDNGFTVFVEKKDDKLKGTTLKFLGYRRGIQPMEMRCDNLHIALEFSAFNNVLGDGKILQMYKEGSGSYLYPTYIAQIGKIIQEEENDCFEIIAEGVGNNFYEMLFNLEEACSKLEENAQELPIKKTYRLQRSSRYEIQK